MMELEHEANRLVPMRRERVVGNPLLGSDLPAATSVRRARWHRVELSPCGHQRLTAYRHNSARRIVEAAEQMQQGALSRSARSDDGDDLTSLDRQVQAVEYLDRSAISAAVGLGQFDRLEDAHSWRMASTGYRLAAWRAGYSVATAAIAMLASTIDTTSKGCVATGRWSMKYTSGAILMSL